MLTVEQKIKQVIDEYTRISGHEDYFKVWVENINCGEKYIVHCSFRYTWGYHRKTGKYQTTIT